MSTITVTPEHNELGRFQAMRLAPYTTAEVLAELIDNSNSARRKDQDVVRVDINIYQDPKTKQYILSLQDNASGIQDTDLGKVLGQANSIGGGTNNEHGMGLKQAAFTGETFLRSIETKTLAAPVARKASFAQAEDVLKPFDVVDSTTLKAVGSRLEIVLPPEHPLLNKTEYYNALSELQLIYQKVLDKTLRVTAKNDALKLPVLNLQADAASSQIYNPIKNDDSWVIEETFKGTGPKPWAASVRIGFIDEQSFKPNLSVSGTNQTPLPTEKTRHGRGQEKQGIFIFKGDRLIQKTRDWTLESSQNLLHGKLSVVHNALNGLVFEIHFDKSFPTTPTKNRLKDDAALVEFRKELIGFLRQIHPDAGPGLEQPQGMSLHKYLLQWNNPEKTKFHPAADLPWHHKQVKFQKDWKSLSKFGSWSLWQHEGKVLAVHKDGLNAKVSRQDIPEMRAMSEHIQQKTKGKATLPIFVNIDPSQLDFSHYNEQYKPAVLTPSLATKEVAHGTASMSPQKQALHNASVVVTGMTQAMLKLPPSLQRAVLDMVSKDVGLTI